MARTVDGRLAYADLLRILATIAVVVLHISAGWLDQTTVGSTSWTVMCTYDALVRWCVPMFVMLSGAFLLDPKKSVNLRDIFFKYILRILVALLVWGTLYALVDYGHSGWHFTWAGIKSALNHVLWADTHYHLWFLYMMIGLYLVTPILRAFVRGASRGTFHWFFLLAFVFCSLLPTLQALFPNRMALPLAWSNRLNVQLVLGYVGYYVAGYYLKNYTLGRIAEFSIYILGILGAVATVWGTTALSGHTGTFNSVLFEYRAPNVVFMAIAVFVLFRYVLGVSEERSRRQRLGGMARITFGIFLVHDFFIILLRHFDISTLSFNPIISIPVLSAAVFLCSFAVSWLISKIPLLGRYLT
ncbi:MAG: acyltransferase [Oscillospiraceae bacterium]